MEFAKFIKSAFLFILITSCLYSIFIFALVKIKMANTPLIYRASDMIVWKGGNSYQKFIDFDMEKKYDLIVIGSSHAYRGYDPRIFEKNGKSLFNLGTSAQSLLNSYYIAKEYIQPDNCELVILDIFDGSLSSDGIESTADLIQNISSDKVAIQMAFAVKDPRAINMFAVRILSKNEPPMFVDSLYLLNGYSEKKDSVKYIKVENYKSSMKPNEIQLNYFESLLVYFKEIGKRVIVVSHPLPLITDKRNHQLFVNLINPILNKNQIEYLDYSFNHNLDSKIDFYDHHHLNQNGVEKFNTQLIIDLKEKKYIE